MIASPSSTAVPSSDSGTAEKAAAPAKPTIGEGSKESTENNRKASSPPRKPSQPRQYSQSQSQQQSSPRKFSHQPQSQQQQSSSPPRRKFSQRQQQSFPQYAPYQNQQQPPFNQHQQFQPSWRKMSNQRQQSLPTFRTFQQPLPQDQNWRDRDNSWRDGNWQQQRPTSGQRRGSSVSVSYQPHQEQNQHQKAYRKTSYQQQPTAGYQQQQQQQQIGATGIDRRRHSTGGKNRKKSDATGAAPVPGRPGRISVAGPRWSSLSETLENGSGDYDYYTDEFEMEEPFSESDEDETPEEREARYKRQAKPLLLLPMPRRRIRTLSGMIPAVGYAPVWGGPTMCLNCLEFFDLPKQTAEYVQHLLDKHKIVVTDIELIVDLKRYIEHWRHRFGQQPIDKIFPLVTPTENDPLFGKVDNYYLMSEKVPEDRQIRERLALRRLEEVLSCQQREREDRTFNRQCLFCRYRTKGNRAKLVHHLYTIHHLNLGSPDNLVFVSEYLDVLEGKLKRNECIYCEKTFPDHPTLSEHMRKKQHREVNPKNNYYDRFYVINYLELGKKWLEVLAEDFEDNTPTFVDSEEEEEEESWNEWQEDAEDENEMTAVCLFCDEAYQEAPKLLSHMNEEHHYDLKSIFAEGHLKFYDRVKFINYIRKLSHECVCFVCGTEDLRSWPALRKHLGNAEHLTTPVDRSKWDKDEYLIPTYDNDNLLCLLEDILELNEEDFGTFVSTGNSEPVADSILANAVHDTIMEDNEDGEKEEEESTLQRKTAEEEETKKEPTEEEQTDKDGGDEHQQKQDSETSAPTGIVVIPEDLPELEDSALNDPELREQLQ